mmetsp:Transcript_6354/g.8262  ORF Transcript_6354/g.8262 Transcript_6354/m.8262 type:complete len:324 (+) Transcript_6354:73-1044(+)
MTLLMSPTTLPTRVRAPASVRASSLAGRAASASPARPVAMKVRRVRKLLGIDVLIRIGVGITIDPFKFALVLTQFEAAVLQIDQAGLRIAVGAFVKDRVNCVGICATIPEPAHDLSIDADVVGRIMPSVADRVGKEIHQNARTIARSGGAKERQLHIGTFADAPDMQCFTKIGVHARHVEIRSRITQTTNAEHRVDGKAGHSDPGFLEVALQQRIHGLAGHRNVLGKVVERAHHVLGDNRNIAFGRRAKGIAVNIAVEVVNRAVAVFVRVKHLARGARDRILRRTACKRRAHRYHGHHQKGSQRKSHSLGVHYFTVGAMWPHL